MRQLMHGAVVDGSGWLLAMMTIVFFLFFVSVAFLAYAPFQREAHRAASLLPLDDELEPQ